MIEPLSTGKEPTIGRLICLSMWLDSGGLDQLLIGQLFSVQPAIGQLSQVNISLEQRLQELYEQTWVDMSYFCIHSGCENSNLRMLKGCSHRILAILEGKAMYIWESDNGERRGDYLWRSNQYYYCMHFLSLERTKMLPFPFRLRSLNILWMKFLFKFLQYVVRIYKTYL